MCYKFILRSRLPDVWILTLLKYQRNLSLSINTCAHFFLKVKPPPFNGLHLKKRALSVFHTKKNIFAGRMISKNVKSSVQIHFELNHWLLSTSSVYRKIISSISTLHNHFQSCCAWVWYSYILSIFLFRAHPPIPPTLVIKLKDSRE